MYEPAEDSFLLLGFVKKYSHGNVLDMGTGAGIIALEAAKQEDVDHVLAIDIDQECIKHVNETIKKEGLNKIECLRSDLFENVHEKFDAIFFNPPYLPYENKNELKHKDLIGGKKGNEIVKRFLQDAAKFLNKNGKIILLLSSLTAKRGLFKGFNKKIIAKRKFFFETLYVYELSLKD
jgi:release factor glutamine methyltransferase